MMLSACRGAMRGAQRGALLGARRYAQADTNASKIDPFEVFEGRVEDNCTDKEVREAYRDLVKKYHPDLNPDADPKKIIEINEANRLLIKMVLKNKTKTGLIGNRATGDEPPVPRSELHERVYKASETRWEESTTQMLWKIKKKYGSVVFWIAKVLFEIAQFVRGARVLVMIFAFMSVVGVIKQMMSTRHLKQMKERREKAEAEGGAQPTLKLTLA